MMMYNIVAIVIWLLVLPIALGLLFGRLAEITYDDGIARVCFAYAMGHVLMWAVFQLVAVPFILLHRTLSVLVIAYIILLVFVVVLAIVRLRKTSPEPKKKEKRQTESAVWILFSAVFALCIVGYQCYKYIVFTHIDDDDSRFIVNAVDAYERGTLFLTHPGTGELLGTWVGEMVKDVSSPWSIWLAVLAKLLHIYPTIVAHTVYPAFLLVIGYAAYYLLGYEVFHGSRIKSFLTVAIAATVNMTFGQSVFNQSYFTIVRIWQGKAVVAGALIPFLTYLLVRLYRAGDKTGSYIALIPTAMAMCLMSGMGIFFAGIMIGLFGLWFALITKNYRKIVYVLLACVPTIVYGLSYVFVR